MTYRARITLAIVLVLGIVIVGSIMNTVFLTRFISFMNETYSDFEEHNLLVKFSNALSEWAMSPNDYLITWKQEEKENFAKLDKELSKLMKEIKASLGEEYPKEIKTITANYLKAKEIALKILNLPPLSPQGAELMEEMDRYVEKMQDTVLKILELQSKQIEKEIASEIASMKTYRASSIAGGIIATILVIIAFIFGINPVFSSIERIAEEIEELSHDKTGNREIPLIDEKGVVGKLIRSFNAYLKSLKQTIDDVEHISHEITENAVHIEKLAKEQAER